ncbi:DUF4097 family beta strand repeat-containing protein [Methanogenium cariaci]|jgi:putative adhesin
MMKKIQFTTLFLALFLAAAIPGCTDLGPGPEVTAQFDDEYEADDSTILRVVNSNGQISINSREGDTITLNTTKKSRFGEDELENIEITAIKNNNEITIKATSLTVIPPMVSVDMDITVPTNVTVDSVEQSNGEIRISGTKGDMSASCSNGEITMNNVDGYVSARVDNGNIEIRETTGIDELEVSNGNIVAEIYDIRNGATIKTINGEITVSINPSLNAAIEMKTTNGIISVKGIALNFTRTEVTHMEGVLGNGGDKITIENTNGNVNVKAL